MPLSIANEQLRKRRHSLELWDGSSSMKGLLLDHGICFCKRLRAPAMCPDARFSMVSEMGLGGATGVFTSVAICPFEVLKVRQQVQPSPLDCLHPKGP